MLYGSTAMQDRSCDPWNLSEMVGAAMDDADHGFSGHDDVQLGGWSAVHPHQWTSSQILDWIFSVARRRGLDLADLRAEAFSTLQGTELCNLSRDEFIRKDSVNGGQLYDSLQQILNNYSPFTDMELPYLTSEDLTDIISGADLLSADTLLDDVSCDAIPDCTPLPKIGTFIRSYSPPDLNSVFNSPLSNTRCLSMLPQSSIDSGYESTDSFPGSEFTYLDSSPAPNLPEFINCYNDDSPYFGQSQLRSESFQRLGNVYNNSAYMSTPTSLSITPLSPTSCLSPLSIISDTSSAYSSAASSPASSDLKSSSQLVSPRRPGRPRKQPGSGASISSQNNGVKKSQSNGTRKRPQGNRSTHLWEFMRNLLDDKAYNPSCIKWEDEDTGVFRIVPGRSQDIARLWGQRKSNSTMTFDKLSRSLRWCRTYGFLATVPKDKGYPKKLCFMFGEKALEWDKTKAMEIRSKCQKTPASTGSA